MLSLRSSSLYSYHVARRIPPTIFLRNKFTCWFKFFSTKLDLWNFYFQVYFDFIRNLWPHFSPWLYKCCELWPYGNLYLWRKWAVLIQALLWVIFCIFISYSTKFKVFCNLKWKFPCLSSNRPHLRRHLFNTCTTSYCSREFPSLRLSSYKQSLILPPLGGEAIQTTADYLKC